MLTPSCLKAAGQGTLLTVRVRTRTRGFAWAPPRTGDAALAVSLKAPPAQGKANAELLARLSKALGAPVRLVAGAKSRRKTLWVGASPTRLASLLQRAPLPRQGA